MGKRIAKVISIILTISFVLSMFSAFSTNVFAETTNALKTKGGFLFFEAEDLKYDKGVLEEVKDKKLWSGGIALKAIVQETTAVPDDSPAHIDLSFTADVDGTYTLWSRNTGRLVDGSGHSCYMSIDNKPYTWTQLAGSPEAADWSKLATVTLKAGQESNIRFRVRQIQDIAYDAFLIVNNGYRPTDATAGLEGLLSVTPRPTPKPNKFETDKDYLVLEAENMEYNEDVLEVLRDNDASGRKALQVLTEDKVYPNSNQTADIDLSFIPNKTGIYYIWLRSKADPTLSSGNSVFYSSGKNGAYKYTMINGLPDEYQWTMLGTVVAAAGDIGYSRLIRRQRGYIALDKFIITNDVFFNPTGKDDVPAEDSLNITLPDDYPKPSVTPPPSHPMLMFTADDLETIKKNMESDEHKAAVEEFNHWKSQETDGILPDKPNATNYDVKPLAIIEAKAFDYALTGNVEQAKKAITAMKNYADTCTYTGILDYSREMGHVIFTLSEVYDWCYPVLTDEDKKELFKKGVALTAQTEMQFPPKAMGSVSGHGGEMQFMRDILALAIATSTEQRSFYDYVVGRLYSDFVPPRNYWFASQTHHQGNAYGLSTRFVPEIWAEWLINRMSGTSLFTPDMKGVAYRALYVRRPDGQLLREGDDFNEDSPKNLYANTIANTLFYVANYYKDPVLKREFLKDGGVDNFVYDAWSRTGVQFLIFNDPTIGTEKKETLPLTKYFGSPQGSMIARTGWNMGMDSPDVLAYMKIGELWGANHNHLDAGNFQIYYKGILASESGKYAGYGSEHDMQYHKASIAHNTLLIGSDSDPIGHQRTPGGEAVNFDVWMAEDNYVTGEVIGHEFGPQIQAPEYSYLAGDIAKAYTDNVKEALRSMLFMPLDNDEHPAAFIVFDKVETDKAGYKKSFMLHVQEEPSVSGNVSTIVRKEDGYNGKLVNQTLLPKEAKVEIIGGDGKEFMVGDKNIAWTDDMKTAKETAQESGWGRIEISPSNTKETDYFLNVMYVGDADKNDDVVSAELIETDKFVGAKIFNRVAMFGKDKARTKDKVEFTVSGDGEYKVNVAGLYEGTWSVKVNGQDMGNQISSKDGGIIYFTAPAGSYELTYVGDDANKTFEQGEIPYVEGITIFFNQNYLYSDVPPTIIDGRTLVPMRAISEAMNADVSWDEATATATVSTKTGKDDKEIKLTENQKTAYINGEAVELDVPAMILDGRFVLPVRFVTENLGAKVEWDAYAQRVEITAKTQAYKKWDFDNVIEVQEVVQSGDDGAGAVIQNSVDGLLSSRWAPQGKDGDAWGIYDLGTVYTLDKIKLAYLSGNTRTYYFDIEVSEDGENYTPVITGGKSSGTTNDFEDYDMKGVKARYVKYIGGGNSANLWNSMTEIVFIEKK